MSSLNYKRVAAVLRWSLCAIALVAVTALITSRVVSDDKNSPAGHKMSPEEQKMMDECIKLGAPGERHKSLDPLLGEWIVATKFWMAPDAPPGEGAGTCSSKSILGGRFILESHEGSANNQPFSGRGITGYDNFKKKYNNVWIDNMGTGMMISYGTADPSGKVITFSGEYDDPMTKATKKVRSVLRIINESKHVFEMYSPGPDGKEFKNLEVTSTRK